MFHPRTFIKWSRISQVKIPGFSRLRFSILASTSGVATRGLLPPITPGLMDPVSWYLLSIFETQPWDTRSCREITQGLTPAAAISTILSRMWFGKGRPLMNTPPSWLTRPCPERKYFLYYIILMKIVNIFLEFFAELNNKK